MANITKRNDGYRIRVSAGFDGNGKRLFATTTYRPTSKTPKAIEKEVQKYAFRFEEEVKNGNYSFDKGIKFSDFVKTWESDWASEHLSQSQQEAYISHLEKHVIPVIGMMKLSKIKKKDCIGIVNNMKVDDKAPKTIRRIVTSMRSVFKYAMYLELINSDPCEGLILPPIKKDNEIHCFDVNQARTFLNALTIKYPMHVGGRKRKDSSGQTYSVKEYVTYKEIPLQFRVYFTLAIKGGFRRGEMIALTWNDIDFQNHTISITKAVASTKKEGQIVKDTKTVSGNREVYLSADCFDLLDEWLDTQKELSKLSAWKGKPYSQIMDNNVFIQSNGTMMDLHTPENRFKSILTQYNKMIEEEADTLPPEKKTMKLNEKLPVIRLHDLRHTFATIAIANGVDVVTVSKLMGHSSPSITMDVYSHLLKKNAEDVAKVFDKLFAPEVESQAVSYMN